MAILLSLCVVNLSCSYHICKRVDSVVLLDSYIGLGVSSSFSCEDLDKNRSWKVKSCEVNDKVWRSTQLA